MNIKWVGSCHTWEMDPLLEIFMWTCYVKIMFICLYVCLFVDDEWVLQSGVCKERYSRWCDPFPPEIENYKFYMILYCENVTWEKAFSLKLFIFLVFRIEVF